MKLHVTDNPLTMVWTAYKYDGSTASLGIHMSSSRDPTIPRFWPASSLPTKVTRAQRPNLVFQTANQTKEKRTVLAGCFQGCLYQSACPMRLGCVPLMLLAIWPRFGQQGDSASDCRPDRAWHQTVVWTSVYVSYVHSVAQGWRVSNIKHETCFSHGGGQMLPEGQVEHAMPLRVSTLNWHKDTPIRISLAKASPKAKFKINRMGKYTLPMKAEGQE